MPVRKSIARTAWIGFPIPKEFPRLASHPSQWPSSPFTCWDIVHTGPAPPSLLSPLSDPSTSLGWSSAPALLGLSAEAATQSSVLQVCNIFYRIWIDPCLSHTVMHIHVCVCWNWCYSAISLEIKLQRNCHEWPLLRDLRPPNSNLCHGSRMSPFNFVYFATVWNFLVYLFVCFRDSLYHQSVRCLKAGTLSCDCRIPVLVPRTAPHPESAFTGQFLDEWMDAHGFWANTY